MNRQAHKIFRLTAAALLTFAVVANVVAVPLPVVPPARVSMSAERLAFIDAAVAESVGR